jgi:hypothetical protein
MNLSRRFGKTPIFPSWCHNARSIGWAVFLVFGAVPAAFAADPPVVNTSEKGSEKILGVNSGWTAPDPDPAPAPASPLRRTSWEPGNPVPPTDVGAPADSAGNKWLDDLSLFLGLDGSKAPEDLGINANFGLRGAVNWGLPLWEEHGLGLQVGSAINYSQTAVRVLRSVDGTRDRTQVFTTVGLFQRTAFGLNWGLVYDFLDERYYEGLDLSQWRGQVGYALDDRNEVGIWGTLHDRGDHGTVAGESFHLRSITQGNFYWRHIWCNEMVTRIWAGIAEEHGRFVLVAPGNTPVHHPFVFGADLYVPITDRLSLWGEANFITPNDTGTVTATLGFAFYPGAGAKRTVRSLFAPLLPLANNATFAVDLRQ